MKSHSMTPPTATHIVMGLFVAIFALTPEIALAAPWDGAAQAVFDILNSGLTRMLAIIAVVACGIAAFFGKLSWDWAVKIVIGIVLVFGASTIVQTIIDASV